MNLAVKGLPVTGKALFVFWTRNVYCNPSVAGTAAGK